jgi:DNA repair exonuclease SbcCD ATPase subunit
MDLDQIIKRLEWLDDERRKDKTLIATLEDRIMSLEGNSTGVAKQVNSLSGEISRLGVWLARIEQIEATIVQVRVESNRIVEGIEKQRVDREREVEKVRLADLEGLNKAIFEVRKGQEVLPEIRRSMQLRIDEEFRLGRLIDELEKKFLETQRVDEESRRSQRLVEENLRQDSKRLTDLQAEISAFRKRLDEQRSKVELATENFRKTELRINDFQSAETERRQAQTAFIEKQNLFQVEKNRTWKEWSVRFEEITNQATNIEAELQALDATNRALKRSQEAFDEITQTFERRMNEITEMQRLTEDRFRQEWVTFKADDQKRWANYTLTNEEQSREAVRRYEKIDARTINLEDSTQELRDMANQMNVDLRLRLQKMIDISHEWLDNHDRMIGNSV